MVRTYGLTHISLSVASAERSLEFYRKLLGVEVLVRLEHSIQVQTPGSHDVITFHEKGEHRGERGGIEHFGFRLLDSVDIDQAIAAAESLGAAITRRGEFAPGVPYVYLLDPDGYELEIWFE